MTGGKKVAHQQKPQYHIPQIRESELLEPLTCYYEGKDDFEFLIGLALTPKFGITDRCQRAQLSGDHLKESWRLCVDQLKSKKSLGS